ncbi:flagellar biosynthesis protein FlhF [Roseateles depolymerans]|uniref:Flagellar biosynthesis protein FlhF n=1 Tax=Roseateles depolymerans TaxID=76731 RepID=A0A0U3N1Z4_9BURK|nr:flagellar biosynthesis protein FlhF [Roseateles depolymerans]ALV06235.1 Flagellar GTP-binding protein [Roseateles depolymerans]REG19204.1 flagellar biosynthesis protein FlhF [Roseateles depolymerans]
MNVKRFTARNTREAMNLVRQAFGDDAVVLSNKPCPEGVEVLAMAPEGMSQIERVAASAPRVAAPRQAPQASARAEPQPRQAVKQRLSARQEPGFANSQPPSVGDDVNAMAMSTLSFQDYVRERMLKRRAAEMNGLPDPVMDTQEPAQMQESVASMMAARDQRARSAMQTLGARRVEDTPAYAAPAQHPAHAQAHAHQAHGHHHQPQASQRIVPPVLRDEIRVNAPVHAPDLGGYGVPSLDSLPARREQEMMTELRAMKGLIEERFGALAFMEKLQRQPTQARLTQKLLDAGFSPALVRKLVEGLPAHLTEESDWSAWAGNVLSRNVATAEQMPALEDQGGVFAMIGSTGVGKTTTTAKIAAAFATKYGASQLGLITLDAYRIGAHEQLRAYGRILGVPVHTAHDRASLEDLLDLLAAKKMVLIDTAGTAQRDSRTAELLDMLAHRNIKRILVVNAAQQGETIEDVVQAWRGSEAQGVILSKIDEAVKLAPALDTVIRHKLRVLGVANGQRVPEDWHRLSSQALVQRALRSQGPSAWRMDASDVNLIFASGSVPGASAGAMPAMGMN